MTAVLLTYFIFGCIVGSFLNVVIFRLHSGRSFVKGRSECLACKHELSALDLVPLLSFAFLRGKCRYCGTRLSLQYPVVEFATGIVFVLVAAAAGGQFNLPAVLTAVLACFFVVVAVYDFKHLLILDKVILPGAIIALLGNIALDISRGCGGSLLNCQTVSGIAGAVLTGGFFLLQYAVSKGRWIGFGDVKFGVLLGISAGFSGSIVLLFLAYLCGAAVGIALIAAGRKRLSSRLPFGTFLSFSAIITLLYGRAIVDWYLGLIGF